VMDDDFEGKNAQTDGEALIEINSDWTIEGNPTVIATIEPPEESDASDRCNLVASAVDIGYDSIDLVTSSDDPNFRSSNWGNRDQLSLGTPNQQQALLTGRLGELLAFNYFATNSGKANVMWVNQDNETGLPYDIVIENVEEKSKEYIEVKTTKSSRKDWFLITVREWQFAVEKGELFSIACVCLSGNNMARITVFKNPARLCHQKRLRLAVVIPRQQQESSAAP
ncbi:hypothetical protein U1Q18_030678, partial [Sarracenia purpurea var. burkii]